MCRSSTKLFLEFVSIVYPFLKPLPKYLIKAQKKGTKCGRFNRSVFGLDLIKVNQEGQFRGYLSLFAGVGINCGRSFCPNGIFFEKSIDTQGANNFDFEVNKLHWRVEFGLAMRAAIPRIIVWRQWF